MQANEQWQVVEDPKINTSVAVLNLNIDTVTTVATIVFDKARYIKEIDLMPLESITAGWLKSIKDEAIKIDKRLYEPVKAWRAEVDEIIAYAEARIASLKAEEAKIEAKRKEDKQTEVSKLIDDLKAKSDLPAQYLNEIKLKTEYLQKGFTGSKLDTDIQMQFDTQAALKKGADDAAELKKVNAQLREALLDKLNAQYGLDIKVSDVLHIENNSSLDAYFASKQKIVVKFSEAEVVKSVESVLNTGLVAAPIATELNVMISEIKDTTENKKVCYKKLLIGGDSAMQIAGAVAKLKTSLVALGLTVEFIQE